ncbi:SDR family NAD(P)-dependent oxidoreductase [Natronorarus salvus]|uniref:SDR family NAD(P)-dependent oxidoreductase n=1 Tax=Natronorarus salvus TaxID=3117733 RepID=UPI003907E7CA
MSSNDTAIVTGGGRGIGRGISVELANRGIDIVVADIDDEGVEETTSLVEANDQRGLGVHMDLRRPESVESAVEASLEAFDSIDFLVNNAGIAGPTSRCEDTTIDAWDDTVEINLRGPFLTCREVLPVMKRQGFGRIVNIASVTGKRPRKRRTPYAASKMGLIGFTRSLAAEVGEHDINVNAVCPGSVDGPRIERVFEKQAEWTGRTPEELRQNSLSASARGEFVKREDVANLVAFLCSEDSDRITGQDFNVSAGKVMF